MSGGGAYLSPPLQDSTQKLDWASRDVRADGGGAINAPKSHFAAEDAPSGKGHKTEIITGFVMGAKPKKWKICAIATLKVQHWTILDHFPIFEHVNCEFRRG